MLDNKFFTPKEALAYFVISNRKVSNKTIDNLVESLRRELILNNNRSLLKNSLNIESLMKIINYWNLTMDQVVAYGYIVFSNLVFEGRTIDELTITDMFVSIMRLHSPDNAVEFVNRRLN